MYTKLNVKYYQKYKVLLKQRIPFVINIYLLYFTFVVETVRLLISSDFTKENSRT